tara:strand:- start:1804 stop:2790 length:987 start_codon:yes stop_codon:yes gene_type:complete
MNNQNKKLFEELKKVSVNLGKNIDLIQANGGNTSIKIDDFIYIKGSGKHLSKAKDENIFAKLPLNKKDSEFYYDKTSKKVIRPSIEKDLHKLMPNKVVLHTHPIDIVSLTMTVKGKNILKKNLNDFDWIWIDYCKPGDQLANAVKKKIREKTNVMVLQNHGLVVGANTAIEAEELHNQILEKVKINPRNFQYNKKEILIRFLETSDVRAYLPNYEVIHSLATDSWSNHLAHKNPHCPDHAVFFGLNIPFIENNSGSLKKIYKKNKYVIVEGLGVFLFEQNHSLEVMLRAQAEVFLRIKEKEDINLLTDNQCYELINWEAEKLRKKEMK